MIYFRYNNKKEGNRYVYDDLRNDYGCAWLVHWRC